MSLQCGHTSRLPFPTVGPRLGTGHVSASSPLRPKRKSGASSSIRGFVLCSAAFGAAKRHGHLHRRGRKVRGRTVAAAVWETASSLTTSAGAPPDALAALLALNAAVIFHESGHFFCARSVSLPAEEFSVGFGPRLVGIRPPAPDTPAAATEFNLRLLPIGGYVRFNDQKTVKLQDGTALNEFEALPAAARLWVLSGGVMSNIVTAWTSILALSLTLGVSQTTPLSGVRVKDVPAEALQRTQLLPNDVLLRVDTLDLSAPGQSTASTVDFIHKLPAQQPVELLVQRGLQEFTVKFVPLSDIETGFQRLGVTIVPNVDGTVKKAADFSEAAAMASATTQRILSEQFAALLNILNQTGPGEVIGPVGILEQGERLASTEGLSGIALFFVSLNLNLALINALPIPGLDGGKALFVVAEQALGQRLDEETKGEVEVLFFLIIFGSFIALTVKDVSNLFGP